MKIEIHIHNKETPVKSDCHFEKGACRAATIFYNKINNNQEIIEALKINNNCNNSFNI